MKKLKPFPEKVRQNIKNRLNQNLVEGTFIENGFEDSLSSRTNIMGVWNQNFLVFCKFLIEEVETILWEARWSKANYLNHNLVKRSFLENGFETTLSSKTKVLSVWKRYVSFFANFWVTKLKPFFRKVRQCWENFLHKVCFVGSLLENVFWSLFDHYR